MHYVNNSPLIVYLPWGRFVTDLIIDKNLAPEIICLSMNINDRLRLFGPLYFKNWDNLVISYLNFCNQKVRVILKESFDNIVHQVINCSVNDWVAQL